MHHFFSVLGKYAVFSGRARRSEFWFFMLCYSIVLLLTTLADLLIGTFDATLGLGLFGGSFFIATLLPMLGVHVRRLHDTGRSGWWVLLSLVPVVGGFALLVLLVFAGHPGTNEYGSAPLPVAAAAAPGDVARRRGRRWLKRLALCAALAVLVAGGARYVWAVHGTPMLAAGKASIDAGRQAGLSLRESGCVAEALRRHGRDRALSLASNVSNSLRLDGCLQSSRREARFCEPVPAAGEILAVAAWAGAACASHGFVDAFCQNLFQSVVRYCASADRTGKAGPVSAAQRQLLMSLGAARPHSGGRLQG